MNTQTEERIGMYVKVGTERECAHCHAKIPSGSLTVPEAPENVIKDRQTIKRPYKDGEPVICQRCARGRAGFP